MGCVTVCPVDCIYQYTGNDPSFPNQLFIDNDECIDCGACEPECPWQAIFEGAGLPDFFEEDIAVNKKIEGIGDRVVPNRPVDQKRPTENEVKVNKVKWNYNG
jgi:ferredoxin